MPPLVSICIPTHNSEKYIGEAIESALDQTFTDFELVIVDNASTDKTLSLCKTFQTLDKRVFLYANQSNLGATRNFNRCIENSRGQYIKFLMSDDQLAPDCVERMLDVFRQNPSVSLVGCGQKEVTNDGKLVRQLAAYDKEGLVPGRQAAKEILLKMSNDIGAPTSALMRRKDCSTGFDYSLFFYTEMELWCRILQTGDYYFLNEPLSVLRHHPETTTSANFKTFLFLADILQFKDKFRDFIVSEGVSEEDWERMIDHHLISYIDYVFLEHGITPGDAKAFGKKIRSIVGSDFTADHMQAITALIYYVCERLHQLNRDERWLRGHVSNLEREIDKMTSTLVWRMAKPLRAVRTGLHQGSALSETKR